MPFQARITVPVDLSVLVAVRVGDRVDVEVKLVQQSSVQCAFRAFNVVCQFIGNVEGYSWTDPLSCVQACFEERQDCNVLYLVLYVKNLLVIVCTR